jgi:hypothetical protein
MEWMKLYMIHIWKYMDIILRYQTSFFSTPKFTSGRIFLICRNARVKKKNVGVKHATFRMSWKTSAQKFWTPWTQWKICLQNISLNFPSAVQPSEGLHLIRLCLYVHLSCNGYMVMLFYDNSYLPITWTILHMQAAQHSPLFQFTWICIHAFKFNLLQ